MKLTDKEKTIKSLKSGAIGGESMKYKVKHTEIWSWDEIIEAKNEENCQIYLMSMSGIYLVTRILSKKMNGKN
jgi:hypothetical protein